MDIQKAALISVSDKTGVIEFAKALSELDYRILSSSGTAKHLKDAGVTVELVEEYTGQKEILGGRVKTLHPKIHAGILANREKPEQIQELAELGAYQIDIVAVNLYPFTKNLESEVALDYCKMIELVDIGGPAMLRAAAKNFTGVYSVVDSGDYSKIIDNLKSGEEQLKAFRKDLAVKVFQDLANYNLMIARYFSQNSVFENPAADDFELSPVNGGVLKELQELRYGENPHQSAKFYTNLNSSKLPWQQLGGKDLSYNNFLDFNAAADCAASIDSGDHVAVIIKHLNPCGVAISKQQVKALKLAKSSDPRSHFGGIIAFNQPLEEDTAAEVIKDFAEIVVAPDFSAHALEILRTKKNLRIIKLDYSALANYEMRSCVGGILIQESDRNSSDSSEAELQTEREPSTSERQDLKFAWQISRSVKSNAIVIVKDQRLLATGAGQMSRVDSTELALHKAKTHGHDLDGAVAASDAFFPFSDSIEALAAAGVKAVITPGGSMNDQEVIEKTKELGISLLFTKDRHFRH